MAVLFGFLSEAGHSSVDDADLRLTVMLHILDHGADGLVGHARHLEGMLQLCLVIQRAAAGVGYGDGFPDQHFGYFSLIRIAGNESVLCFQQSAHAVYGHIGGKLVPDGVHDVFVDVHFQSGFAEGLRHLQHLFHRSLESALIGGSVAGMTNMAGRYGSRAESGIADDDLLLGDHLGDLIIVAQSVLQAEYHCMPVYHGKRVPHGGFQILIVDKNDHQVH